MVAKMTVDIGQVRADHGRNIFLDGRYRPGLPCHEVDGFGDLQYDPTYAPPADY